MQWKILIPLSGLFYPMLQVWVIRCKYCILKCDNWYIWKQPQGFNDGTQHVEITADYNNKSISPIDKHKSNEMSDKLIRVQYAVYYIKYN